MMVATRNTRARTSVTIRATQPMPIATLTSLNEPAVSEPDKRSYTPMKTGKMIRTAKSKMALMMQSKAVG